ncbi:MAG TPA: hypothetical protein VK926_02875, partial [Gaiellaceae bacterium]|nr:hypothetical protein [Gaiellaceae bacterium]
VVSDAGLALSIEEAEDDEATDEEATTRALGLVAAIPIGVVAMSADVPGAVEASTSLNVARTHENVLTLASMTRSADPDKLDDTIVEIERIARERGATVEVLRSYPPWRPDLETSLLATARVSYRRLFGSEPRLEVVHGGLECAVIGGKLPGVEMISLGPEIVGPHAPGERLSISGTERFYRLLRTLLDDLSR